jgi:glycosyltransferase involved in cell wall biosynthesis
MILGVPCISSDFKVAFEQIKDGKNGIILSCEDTDSYKDRIDDIMENKAKYKKAVQKYGYKNSAILKKWDDIFGKRS